MTHETRSSPHRDELYHLLCAPCTLNVSSIVVDPCERVGDLFFLFSPSGYALFPRAPSLCLAEDDVAMYDPVFRSALAEHAAVMCGTRFCQSFFSLYRWSGKLAELIWLGDFTSPPASAPPTRQQDASSISRECYGPYSPTDGASQSRLELDTAQQCGTHLGPYPPSLSACQHLTSVL